MKGSNRYFTATSIIVLLSALAFLGSSTPAFAQESGQRAFGQSTVEPAVDYANGDTIYLLTPDKSPFPSKANPIAVAPLYLPLYPLTSTLTADDFNCQPSNCDHVNVLPFPSSDYGSLAGTDQACVDFNGSQPCSRVKGHDHLVGVAKTKGDFNVAWHVYLVVFTHKGFVDGAISTRILTLNQLNALATNQDVVILDTPVTFNCSITSESTYERGTPVVIPFP